MMGPAHALTGAVAWSVIVALHPPPLPVLAAGYAITAGAALLPDIDHGSSTATRSLGVLTKGLAWGVRAVSGGHRRGTHSLAGAVVLAAGVQVAVSARPNVAASIGLTVLLAVILAAFVRLFKIDGGWDEAAALAGAAFIAWWPGLDLTLLAPAVLVGVLVHDLGDAITVQGIPFFWPLSGDNVRLAKLRAGGTTERWVIRPLAVVAIPLIPLWDPALALLGH
jgi:membrane-bound metal-dependent hydrolase YbcI (DUF457 family)